MIHHAVACVLLFCWPVHGHHHHPRANHARHHHVVIEKKVVVEKRTVIIERPAERRGDIPLSQPVPW